MGPWRTSLLLLALACLLRVGVGGAVADSGFEDDFEYEQSKGSDPRSLKIMPLGDSITQGEAGHASYRYFLFHMLVKAGYRVDFVGSQQGMRNLEKLSDEGQAKYDNFDRDHEGHWGLTTEAALEKADDWLKDVKPDVVLIHLGTNNLLPAGKAVSDLRKLLHKLRESNPQVVTVVAQLLPVQGLEPQVRAFNRHLLIMAAQEQQAGAPVVVVDMNQGFDAKTHFYDGTHLNEAGEYLMAQRWFKAVRLVRDNTHRINAYRLSGTLAPLERLRRAQDYGGISAEIDEWMAGGRLTGKELDKAVRLLDDIAIYKDAQMDRVAYLAEQKRYYVAEPILMDLRKQFRGTEVSDRATEQISEWRRDPAIANELAAADAMARAGRMVELGRYEQAHALYETIARTQSGTKAAYDASALAAGLVARGQVAGR